MNDAYLRLLFCTRMNSQSTIARTPVLISKVSLVGQGANQLSGRKQHKALSPFQCGQPHDVQTCDSLPPLFVVHLTALSPPRTLYLVLIPLLIVMPNFCDRERIGLVLLVRQQEERDAEDLRGGKDGV